MHVTVPADCIFELMEGITASLNKVLETIYNTNCTIRHKAWAQIDRVQHDGDDTFSESHLATLFLTNETTSLKSLQFSGAILYASFLNP